MSHDAQRTDGSWDGPNYAAEHATVLGIRAWPGPATVNITEVHTTFRRWLGEDYDLDALDVVLATAAVEQLGGDPVWVLVLSGSGNAKTETVAALAGGRLAGGWDAVRAGSRSHRETGEAIKVHHRA